MSKSFKALWITESDGEFQRKIIHREVNDLPQHDTLIRVHYSSLNYKDALSINGHKGITRNFPHQPGIDAAGEVVETSHPDLQTGQPVIVTGYDLGMNTDGGLGQYIRVPSDWIVPLPDGMSLFQAMIYGTAGFTAALGLWLLERNGQQPEHGKIVVTGATGGVGSMAVAIVSQAGYDVIASTGKKDSEEQYLKELGATDIVDRNFVDIQTDKLLLKSKWAGGIDTVGGNTLHTLLKACEPYGNIACCGLVQSPNLNISVYPFIINGISLLGIATAENPLHQKIEIWEKLNGKWAVPQLEKMSEVISLNKVSEYVDLMMKGNTKGRIVVDLNKI